MTKIPGFIGPTYSLRTPNFEAQRTINLFMESDEIGPTAKEQEVAMLVSVPGQEFTYRVPKSPIRGLHYTAFGSIICVAGNTVYYLHTPDGGETWENPTPIADLTTSTGPVSIADGIPNNYNGALNSGLISLVIVVDGSNYGIVFEDKTTNAIQLNNGNFYHGANYVTFQDGFFIFTQNTQSPVSFFANDPLNISELDFITVNLGPDYISRIVSDHDVLWMFGGQSCSVYQNTGGSGAASNIFQQIPGSYAEGGCRFPNTIQKVSGQILWVNSDPRGCGMVFQGVGYRGTRISNYAVEDWIQSFPDLSGATAWTYQDRGHSFYVLNIPGSETTWAYDLTQKMWSERAFFKDGTFSRDLVEYHITIPSSSIHLVAGYNSNRLYKLSNNVYTLNNEPIFRMRTAPHASAGFKRVFYSQAQLDIETGIGLDGVGYAYPNGISQGGVPAVATDIPLEGNGPIFNLVGSDGKGAQGIYNVSISASGDWSNSFTVDNTTDYYNPTVTIHTTDFIVDETEFGIGNGGTKNYSFIIGGVAAGNTVNSANIYVSDWRGKSLQSTIQITNLCVSSENFTNSNWIQNGITLAPATWNKYPTLVRNTYRPTIGVRGAPISAADVVTGIAFAYDSTYDTVKQDGDYMSARSGYGSGTSQWVDYSNFGVGTDLNIILRVCAETNFGPSGYGVADVAYSLDNGVTYQTQYTGGHAVAPFIAYAGVDWDRSTPLSVPITVPDLSKLRIQMRITQKPATELKVFDISIISATSTPSTIIQSAPDGSITGTYIIENDSYGQHGIATEYPSINGDTTTVSCYFQPGDSSRNLELVLQDTRVAFSGTISGNQLTVAIPPTSGSLSVGQTIEGAGILPGTTIIAGLTSPYTLSITRSSVLTLTPMVAYKNIAKAHFTPTGVATADIGIAAIESINTVFTGSVAGNQLTVTEVFSGELAIGQAITGVGITGTVLIIDGATSPYTLDTDLGIIAPEIMTVVGGVGIYRCSVSGIEISTGLSHAGMLLYDPTSDFKDTYVGNKASRLGVWGLQIQKGSLTKYIKSASGISGVDYITLDLINGTVSFNIAPYSGAILTWNGTVHGISLQALLFTASFYYTLFPPVYSYLGLDPQVSLSYSDNGGHTFGPDRKVSMGLIGQYLHRCIWRRLGMSRDRVFRVKCCEPVKFNLIGADFKATIGEINQ